jgi:iron complex transport system substrate-binding protein
MRIVSLFPAATEWICTFGAQDALIGRSHACDYPPEILDRPALTRPRFDPSQSSAAIDQAVRTLQLQGLSLYEIDWDQLRLLEPELILTQAQCPVCAVPFDVLQAELATWPEANRPQLLPIAPTTLKQVLDAALKIGRAIGRLPEAIAVLANAEKRLRRLRDYLGFHRRIDPRVLPRVACLEWLDPLIVAGHWMPDVVAMAGGQAVLAAAGQPSRPVSWEELHAADPDVLLLMPCGFSIAQTLRELPELMQKPQWQALSAVQEGRVYVLDGNAYFNRPGPRLYRSIALIAACLYPDRLSPQLLSIAPWELQPLCGTTPVA